MPLTYTIPHCSHFTLCGGCRFRNIRYTKQLASKKRDVSDALNGIDYRKKITVIPSPQINYYRNKMEYACGVWDDELVVGLRVEKKYFQIINLTHCYLQSAQSCRILLTISSAARALGISGYHRKKEEGILRYAVIREGKNTGQVMLNLITSPISKTVIQPLCDAVYAAHPKTTSLLWSQTAGKSDAAVGETTEIMYGQGFIEEKIGWLKCKISPYSFFQTNTHGTEVLYRIIKKFSKKIPADMLLDIYCGTGGIGLYLSSLFKKVIGIEVNPHAVADARCNMKLNNINNVEFICSKAEEIDRCVIPVSFSKVLAVVDPPRPGLDQGVMSFLCTRRPAAILYVSCNPQALKRDLQRLTQCYKITNIQPIDLFPHTPHIETVVVLKAL